MLQPRLSPRVSPVEVANHQSLQTKAFRIASSNLFAGIEKRRLPDGQEKFILCAGVRNFREPWARDFGFASFGLIELHEHQVTRECLEVFYLNQTASGQFPVKVHSTNVVNRYLHSLFKREQPTSSPLKPKYITAHNTISLDGNALLIIATLNYARRTGDHQFVRFRWNNLKQAANWLEKHALEADGLLHQKAFADWADSIAREGRILYTNVLFWKALQDLAETAGIFNLAEDRYFFAAKANYVKKSINEHFWRNDLGYFVTSQVFDNLSSSGNLLAIAWEMTSTQQAHSILDNMQEFGMADPIPTQVVHRPYPDKFIAIENRMGGIPHYHTQAAWLWLGAWHVIALARMLRLAEAEILLHRISHAIVRDGTVHEVYAPTGQYLSTFWYTSEAPLTWSAGMVVYAHHVFQRALNKVRTVSN
jgi:GH15 family glucan-1,4-alpha-glucosidase